MFPGALQRGHGFFRAAFLSERLGLFIEHRSQAIGHDVRLRLFQLRLVVCLDGFVVLTGLVQLARFLDGFEESILRGGDAARQQDDQDCCGGLMHGAPPAVPRGACASCAGAA